MECDGELDLEGVPEQHLCPRVPKTVTSRPHVKFYSWDVRDEGRTVGTCSKPRRSVRHSCAEEQGTSCAQTDVM
jgi:hypothetical protein